MIVVFTQVEVTVEPDALEAPLLAALREPRNAHRLCPELDDHGEASASVEGVVAHRPFVGDDGKGTATVTYVTAGSKACRARVAFELKHVSGPRTGPSNRGYYEVSGLRVASQSE